MTTRFLAAGGRFGVGSDSNRPDLRRRGAARARIRQRLTQRSRNVLGEREAFDRTPAVRGGAAPAARRRSAGSIGAIAPGQRADIVVLDREHPSLAAARGDVILDAWIFSADNAAVADVICGGAHVVESGRHRDRDRLLVRYREAVRQLEAI